MKRLHEAGLVSKKSKRRKVLLSPTDRAKAFVVTIGALKRFENLEARRVAEITFEVAHLRGRPLTETPRHGENFLPTTPPSPSSYCFQLSGLPPSLPLMSSFGLPSAGYPASARWHVFSISAFSFVPDGCRIQTHRSRSRYWNGFERALAHSAWVV